MMKLLAKILGLEVVEKSDCPFNETVINGKTVLVQTNHYLVVG